MNNKPIIIICAALAVIAAASVFTAAVTEKKRRENDGRLVAAMAELSSSKLEIDKLRNQLDEIKLSVPDVTEAPAGSYSPPVTDENTIYIYDNGDTIKEYPPIEGARLHDYDMSLLKTDEKKHKVLYDNNGNARSRFGIDVSSYQTDIDWNSVAADGVEFAILRGGYRGYETGSLSEDRYFRRNMEGAYAAGIDIGVYFFSQALTEEEAAEEADYILGLIAETGITPTLPIIFDWEFPTDEDPARTDGMDGAIQTKCCRVFCDRIREAGFTPMYYATISTALFRYDMGALSDIPLWIAEYYAQTDFVYDFKMWQYSCSGKVDGIESLVDLNIYIDE